MKSVGLWEALSSALKGDWKSIEDMTNIQRRISWNEETTLHIAAAANQEDFLKKLLTWMTSNNCNLTAETNAGNTALTYAAAAGNVKIAEMMLKKNPELPNLGRGVKPLSMAAFLGHSQMVQFLYPVTTIDKPDDRDDIFINCVRKDLYGVRVFRGSAGNSPVVKPQSRGYRGDVENSNETSVISSVLFEAAEVGNIEFLVKLICFNFDLLWKRKDSKSIFHIAVEKRHESIFKLLNEIGLIGDLIVGRIFEDGSNILHLAARLAPQDMLKAISGAALQMQLELLWFKVLIHALCVVIVEPFNRMSLAKALAGFRIKEGYGRNCQKSRLKEEEVRSKVSEAEKKEEEVKPD
ncbi:inversin-like [Quercus lobata]|uniref:inversin-like n=1 Tax=Quercus lobata TaxID=97700 RepID=UPI001244F4A3|nr:inversin-like [Quercus lobata]